MSLPLPRLAPLGRRLRRFRRDERGSMAIEGVLMLPLLAWAYVGTFVFFDGYHASSINARAAYTMGDVLSRENSIGPAYMDSLYALQGILTDTEEPRRLRVSAVQYLQTGDRYVVCWSQVRGGAPALTNATLAGLRSQLPVMPNKEVVILTETWVRYTPAFAGSAIDPLTFEDLVVTRPRFAPQIVWNSVDNGTMATEQRCSP